MERIGERLRRRREELGLTLEDVSESIRYRPQIIRAVEEGRSGVFPAKAYLSAFLRAYAVILELDPKEIVREQKSEEERAFEAIRNIRVKPKRRREFPRKVFYILIPIVLAAALLFVVDRFLWEREPDTGPAREETPARAVMRADTASEDSAAASSRPGATSGAEDEGDAESDPPESGTAPSGTPELDNPGGDAGGDDAGSEGASGESTSGGGAESEGAARAEAAPGAAAPEATPADDAPETAPPAAAGPPRDDAGEQEPGAEDVVAAETGDAAETGSAASPAAAPGDSTPPEAEIEAMVPLAEAATEPERRRHKLVVSARRGAYVSVTSGGRSVYDGYFGGGEVDSFFSETPFVIVALTDRGAWTFVHDGERVRLPGSSSEDVSNFVIPLPSDD